MARVVVFPMTANGATTLAHMRNCRTCTAAFRQHRTRWVLWLRGARREPPPLVPDGMCFAGQVVWVREVQDRPRGGAVRA